MTVPPVVHVLLATYNGDRYLRSQWESLAGQEGVEVVVHLADDGSCDRTVDLLGELAAGRGGSIRDVLWVHAPPRRSAARSFLMLLASAVRSVPDAQWFAYCDQDDVWMPAKLSVALAALESHAGSLRPALYGGRTIAIDGEDREHGLSPLFSRPPSFRNALVQNITGANTMVFNRAAALLVAQSAQAQVHWHDWLTYQLVSGVDGFLFYDSRPFVRYRQHASNVMGSNLRWRARLGRMLRMLKGDFREWNQQNIEALAARGVELTAANRSVLDAFRRARDESTPLARLKWLRRSGAFRQKPSEQLMLWLACALGRM